MRNEHSKTTGEILAKSLDSPVDGIGQSKTVWVNKTSEGARKAWEARRANGEGATKPTDAPKTAPKAEAAPPPKTDAVAAGQHRQLIHILTQEDVKRQKREPNIYRLGLFFEALDRAKAHPKGLAAGLRESFEDSPLRNRMLRVVEGKAEKEFDPNRRTVWVNKDSAASVLAWETRQRAAAIPVKPENKIREHLLKDPNIKSVAFSNVYQMDGDKRTDQPKVVVQFNQGKMNESEEDREKYAKLLSSTLHWAYGGGGNASSHGFNVEGDTLSMSYSLPQGHPVLEEKDSEASKKAWEIRQRSAATDAPPSQRANATDSPPSNPEAALKGLQYGDKIKLPPIMSGSDRLEGYTATYVGMQGKNRTYRVLDNAGRFAWNLSHHRLVSVMVKCLAPDDILDLLISQHAEKEEGDAVKACVKRKIPIIIDDHPEMEQAQAVAIAFSMCRKDPDVA